MRFSLPVAALGLVVVAMTSKPASAAGPDGTWLSQDGDVKMKSAASGGAPCSHIVGLKEPTENGQPKVDKNNPDVSKRSRPIIGVPVVVSMKPDGADKWSG